MSLRKISITVFLFSAVVGLAACGGGGGGGNSGGPTSGSSSSSTSSGSSSSSGGYAKADLALDFSVLIRSGYADLDTRFTELATATTTFCGDTSSEENFDALKTSWQNAMQAWQYMQGINFGPIDEDTRRYRIAFYPLDQAQLDTRILDLINGTDEISQELVAGSAVSLQGLVALERIYFKTDALMFINVPSDTARYCALVSAITSNLTSISAPVLDAWQSGGSYALPFTNSANVETSLEDWFGSVVEHLQIIEDTKLRSAGGMNEGDIESPLAQSSLLNIDNNIAFIEAAFRIENDAGIEAILNAANATAVATELQARLNILRIALDARSGTLVELRGSDAGVTELEAIADAVHQVLEYMAVEVAEALDVFIGFNGADGD